MVKIKWTPVIVGLLLAIILGLLFGMFISWGDILGYLIATIFVGYLVGGDYKNGAIHGALVGVDASIIILILSLLGLDGLLASNVIITGLGVIIIVIILALIIGGFFGVIGGLIGVLLKNKV
jgi:Family of unknown function (DUF5518)